MEAFGASAGAAGAGTRYVPSLSDVRTALLSVAVSTDGAGMVDQLRELEDLKSLAAARQAEIAVAFDHSLRQEQASAGVPADEQGTGVGTQVALARRESPARGGRLLGLAKALTEMPRTFTAFRSGQLNEWRTTQVVKETACLSVEDRFTVDEELAADSGTFDGAGDRATIGAVRAAAYRRDPLSVTKRASHAVTERTVTLRPAPDTMAYVTALLPVAQGVAAFAALTRQANTLKSSGDERSKGAIMADTLVERVTGTPGGITGIEVQLVMTDRTLFQGDSEPARLTGYGVVPAGGPDKPLREQRLVRNPQAPRKGQSSKPGFAGFIQLPEQANSLRWTRRPGFFPPDSNASCRSGMIPAAPRFATRPSAITTTSSPGITRAQRFIKTAKASANRATTLKKQPAGRSGQFLEQGIRWNLQPPPAIPTARWRHHCLACP